MKNLIQIGAALLAAAGMPSLATGLQEENLTRVTRRDTQKHSPISEVKLDYKLSKSWSVEFHTTTERKMFKGTTRPIAERKGAIFMLRISSRF